jgi:acyl-CoA thioesterase-1
MWHFFPNTDSFVVKLKTWGLVALFSVFSASFTNAATLLVHGDSLSAGYGMLPEETWVALLAEKLEGDHIVVNSSISGETSKGGLERLPSLLDTYEPDILIIELGANDGLRGYPISEMGQNIQSMIDLAEINGSQVVLLGVRLPPNLGKRYTEPFFNKFAELAESNELAYLPFLLDQVAQFTELMQADGLHPTMDAQPIIFENVLPLITNKLKGS